MSVAERAQWSIQLSNQKLDAAHVSVDNFPTAAAKAWVAIGQGLPESASLNQTQKLKAIQNLNLRIGGMTANKAMVAALEKLNDTSKVNAQSLDRLRRIETLYGRDVITTGYVKLKKLIDICEKEATQGKEPVHEYVLWACLLYTSDAADE